MGPTPLSHTGGPLNWHERFNRSALELIALTATTGLGKGADRVTAAASDAAAPALQKIERAAIAAATPITYVPQASQRRSSHADDHVILYCTYVLFSIHNCQFLWS